LQTPVVLQIFVTVINRKLWSFNKYGHQADTPIQSNNSYDGTGNNFC